VTHCAKGRFCRKLQRARQRNNPSQARFSVAEIEYFYERMLMGATFLVFLRSN